MVSKLREQVIEFHRAFGVPVRTTPNVPDRERVILRLSLLAEEFFEVLDSCAPDGFSKMTDKLQEASDAVTDAIDMLHAKDIRLHELAKELADVDYIVEGTRLEFGLNGEPIAAAVHSSNLAKLGENGQVCMRADGKITKPETWAPPDIEGELRRQGWQP